MLQQIGKAAVAVSAAILISVCGLVLNTTKAHADGNDSDLSQIGLSIIRNTGLTVYMNGKNPDLVGLGSFIVNAQADCNAPKQHASQNLDCPSCIKEGRFMTTFALYDVLSQSYI